MISLLAPTAFCHRSYDTIDSRIVCHPHAPQDLLHQAPPRMMETYNGVTSSSPSQYHTGPGLVACGFWCVCACGSLGRFIFISLRTTSNTDRAVCLVNLHPVAKVRPRRRIRILVSEETFTEDWDARAQRIEPARVQSGLKIRLRLGKKSQSWNMSFKSIDSAAPMWSIVVIGSIRINLIEMLIERSCATIRANRSSRARVVIDCGNGWDGMNGEGRLGMARSTPRQSIVRTWLVNW